MPARPQSSSALGPRPPRLQVGAWAPRRRPGEGRGGPRGAGSAARRGGRPARLARVDVPGRGARADCQAAEGPERSELGASRFPWFLGRPGGCGPSPCGRQGAGAGGAFSFSCFSPLLPELIGVGGREEGGKFYILGRRLKERWVMLTVMPTLHRRE